MLNQRHISGLRFKTVAEAEAAGRPMEVCFIYETKTMYYYATSYPVVIDHLKVLATQNAGFSRWVAFAGQYSVYEPDNSIEAEFSLINTSVSNRWLQYKGVYSNIRGFIAPFDCTLSVAECDTRNQATGIFYIRTKSANVVDNVGNTVATSDGSIVVAGSNFSWVDIASVPFDSSTYEIIPNLGISISSGEEIAVFWKSQTGYADFPFVKLTFSI